MTTTDETKSTERKKYLLMKGIVCTEVKYDPCSKCYSITMRTTGTYPSGGICVTADDRPPFSPGASLVLTIEEDVDETSGS